VRIYFGFLYHYMNNPLIPHQNLAFLQLIFQMPFFFYTRKYNKITSQKFYENCAVNNAETPELKASRLTLCTVTASTIKLLMGLLGIEVVERL